MKKITTYLLQLAAAMMLCSAMASCRADDLADDDEGTLPPGHHPLSFVATVGHLKSRSEGKNFWKEDDQIGVRTINLKGRKYSMIGRYSLNEEGMMKDIVKRYTVSADGSWKELDEEPLEWPYPEGRVSAWYPFDAQVDVAMDNQAEKGFDHLDFLSVTTDKKSYRDVVDLEFKHQMAKVTCRVIPGDGITPEEFETLWLRLQGHTSCTFRETELTGGENIGWITPDSTYNYTEGSLYEALLVPNEMAGKDLISIGLKTNYEGHIIPKHFTYPSPKIEAGMHYIYNITVKKDRIVVSFFTVEWNDEGAAQHEPARFTFRVNLTDELVKLINISKNGANVINTNLVRLSENVTPILNTDTQLYDKFDVLGNEFTISVGANTETRSKNLVIAKNEAVNTPRVVNQSGIGSYDTYVENRVFMIADETTLGYKDELNVGDYFFNDGSWSSVLGWSDVQCIGIVFAVNNGDDPSVFKLTDANRQEYVADKAADYTDNPIKNSNRIRGYVLALTDATRDYPLYKKGSTYFGGTLLSDIKVSWAETDIVYEKGTKYPKGKLIRDLKVVSGGSETVYPKGTEYQANTLANDLRVVWMAMDTEYKKGTVYSGGTLISDVTIIGKIEKFPWAPLDGASAYLGEICSLDINLFNGFSNMISVKGNVGKSLGSKPVPPFEELEALAAAEDYKYYVNAPTGTSGWYLPSIKQLQTALEFIYSFQTHINDSPIVKVKGTTPNGKYWSSTIDYRYGHNNAGGNAWTYEYGNKSGSGEIVKNNSQSVRSILTF